MLRARLRGAHATAIRGAAFGVMLTACAVDDRDVSLRNHAGGADAGKVVGGTSASGGAGAGGGNGNATGGGRGGTGAGMAGGAALSNGGSQGDGGAPGGNTSSSGGTGTGATTGAGGGGGSTTGGSGAGGIGVGGMGSGGTGMGSGGMGKGGTSGTSAGGTGAGGTGNGGTGAGGTGNGGTGAGGTGNGGTGAGGTGNGGTGAGGTGAGGSTNQCPAAPIGATAAQVTALSEVNKLRVAAGSGCATEVAGANGSATAHCAYYAANVSNSSCVADPHTEVMSCTGFTGASFSNRMKAAGYSGQPSFEVMAFSNDPVKAVAQWVNSIWHRIPVLDPWVTELGYGAATGCDTIDFGLGTPAPNDTIVVFPYDGQTAVPTSFDGSREGPMPPAPSTGWPSGSPITLYGKSLTISEHTLTLDGQTTPIDHVFLTAADSSFLREAVMMYANKPLTAATKYHVKITGTSVGGALSREWSFTTK